MGREDRSVAIEGDPAATPPQYPFHPVRTRALEDIESLPALPKLLGIVAPMGYGKTVLMTEVHALLEARGERCFWTTLDERCTRIEDVLLTLERHYIRDGNAPHPTQALFRGEESLDARIESLVRMASRSGFRCTTFIDNLHLCPDPTMGVLLDRLLFETPEDARFVISSTAALPVNHARAKLEGRLRQIGPAELSLDLQGIAELLGSRISDALGTGHLDAVLRQTEGWPAAVRMMQIVMSDSSRPVAVLEQFSGSDEDLVALLNRQVLLGLPAAVREFLLAIAPLHTFDAALCAQVSGSDLAQSHLDWLVRHNIFIVPLDRSRRRYRLHGLFRQCLLAEARRQSPGEPHRGGLLRAAQWCEQHGEWRDAVEYAFAANAPDAAGRVLERSAQAFVRNRGDIPRYIAWVRTLFEQGVTPGFEAEYWYVWALVLNQCYDEGRHHLERLVRRIGRRRASSSGSDALRDLERRLDIIRLCIEVFTDRLPEADRMARQWLDQAQADDPFDITVARCIRSIHCSSAFEFVEARASIQAARSSASQAQSDYARGWVVALTALPAILEGQYAQTYPVLTSSLATLPEQLGDNAGICGTIALLAAGCAVEMGLDEEARKLLDQGLRTADSHGFIDAVAGGLDAALKLWSGASSDPSPAGRLLEIAGHYPPRLAFMLGCHRIRRLLRLGRLAEAQAEAENIGVTSAPLDRLPAWAQVPRGRDAFLSTLVDLQLASGKGRAAAPLVAEQLRWAKSDGRIARMVDLELAELQIEVAEDRGVQARRHLSRAIGLAASRRIVRPFSDLAALLAPLIEDTKPASWAFASPEERRFFGELCARLPIGDPALRDRLVAVNLEANLLDRLTPKEVEMLTLLEAGLSNQQIADRLDRKLSTVKEHCSHLYAKLGVSSRAAALVRARVLKLL